MLTMRKKLSRLVLRGAIVRRWVAWKTAKLENRFRSEVVRASTIPLPAEPKRPVRPGVPLRRIFFLADILWENNDLVPELEKICPVTVLDLRPHLKENAGKRLPAQTVVAAVRAFLEVNRSFEPDLVFFYARPSLLSEEVFELLRKRWSCPLLGMNLDDKVEFLDYKIFSSGDQDYARWAKLFDMNVTNGLAVSDWYRLRGLPCIYSPPGMHQPPGLTMPDSSTFQYEFSFLGSMKPEREAVVNRIARAGIPIQLFGSGWPGGQWVDDPCKIYRGSQLNLGIGLASPSLVLTTTKNRDFDCPSVGACYLTTYNWELTQQYELGKEILCYRNEDELIEMYGYYRKRPEVCLKIAQAAFRRCSAEYTWERRFRKVFQQMGFAV